MFTFVSHPKDAVKATPLFYSKDSKVTTTFRT